MSDGDTVLFHQSFDPLDPPRETPLFGSLCLLCFSSQFTDLRHNSFIRGCHKPKYSTVIERLHVLPMKDAPSLARTVFRTAAALLVGLIAGSFVNLVLVQIGSTLLPLPAVGGSDLSEPAVLNASIAAASPLQLLPPFVAHAGGTLCGAFVASMIAPSRRVGLIAALLIGCAFLLGGIVMVRTLPATPAWWVFLDLIGAYLPMALAGWAIGKSRSQPALA